MRSKWSDAPDVDQNIIHIGPGQGFMCDGVFYANLSDVPGWPQYTEEEREEAHAWALANMDANGNVRVGGARMELAETTRNDKGEVVRRFVKAKSRPCEPTPQRNCAKRRLGQSAGLPDPQSKADAVNGIVNEHVIQTTPVILMRV